MDGREKENKQVEEKTIKGKRMRVKRRERVKGRGTKIKGDYSNLTNMSKFKACTL